MRKDSEIEALISLLDDPDPSIYKEVSDALRDCGTPIIPKLEQAWEEKLANAVLHDRILELIEEIQMDTLCEDFKHWAAKEQSNLLMGLVLVNRISNPELDYKTMENHVNNLVQNVWIEINDRLSIFEKLHAMNEVFFSHYGFRGDSKTYHAPYNSYISDVFDRRKGNPIALSAIYLLVAQRLYMPIFGVNLPSHFVLGFNAIGEREKYKEQNIPLEQQQLHYFINVFSKGALLGMKDVQQFLKEIKKEPQESYFKPCSNLEMIYRFLVNLEFSYRKSDNPEKLEKVLRLKDILRSSL